MKKNNPDQWNLFLLGMERFIDTERTKETTPLSYFQIAGPSHTTPIPPYILSCWTGIHGRPYDNWPKAQWNKDEKIVDAEEGYCTHSSILFLTWHRPYLSLFEVCYWPHNPSRSSTSYWYFRSSKTTLYKHIKDIAEEYGPNENRDRYIKAAESFRLPYWDWAIPTNDEITLFPEEVWSTTVHKVVRPKSNNTPKELKPNPLAGYKFGEVGKGDSNINIVSISLIQSSTSAHRHNATREVFAMAVEATGFA